MTPSSPTEALFEALNHWVAQYDHFRQIAGDQADAYYLFVKGQGQAWAKTRDALAAYAASQADPANVPALNAWNWLAKNANVELSFQDVWEVYRLKVSPNDLEWGRIGEGATPLEAVLAAMAAAGGE